MVDIKKLKEVLKPSVVDTFSLFPKVQELIENNQREDRLQRYTKEEIERTLRKYEEKYADLYLIAYCNYLKEQDIKPILITEETLTHDKKLIRKIPTICEKEQIEFQEVPHALFEIYKDELKFTLDVHSTQ